MKSLYQTKCLSSLALIGAEIILRNVNCKVENIYWSMDTSVQGVPSNSFNINVTFLYGAKTLSKISGKIKNKQGWQHP